MSRNLRKRKLFAAALLTAALACSLPGNQPETIEPSATAALPTLPAATDTALPILPTATNTSLPELTGEGPADYFRWAVVVDLDSEPVSEQEAHELVQQASEIFIRLTGFGMQMVDYQQSSSSGTVSDLAAEYISAHPDDLPNGIIIFSFGDNDAARTFGGYAFALPGPAGFRNIFVSPSEGDNKVYVSVQHWSHRYARCGYGDSTAETPVQGTSLNGECRNQDGIACVEKFGYSMCSTAVDDLYASSRTYFAAATIIHEILHSFGDNGNMDHYATETCNQIMAGGISERPYNLSGPLDLHESQLYNAMCPYTYDNFVLGYQP